MAEFASLMAPVAAGVAIGAAIVSAIFAGRSWPVGIRRVAEDLSERVIAAEVNVESLEAKWHTKQVELAALTEEIEGMLAAVSKRQRRAVAAESAINPGGDSGDPMGAIKARARAQGYRV